MTPRISHWPRRPAPTTASRTTGAGFRGPPITRLRTIDEAAELLNVSARTVRRLIDSGALPVHRFGRLVRIADADLGAFLAASRSV
jgi:excisionase family DNA binding protein